MKKLSSVINEIKDAFKNKKLTGSIYSITLIIFIVIAFILYFLYLPNDITWMIGTSIVTAVIHFILYFLTALFIKLGEERPFVNQYNKVMEQYEQTDDPQQLYEGLINIKFLPVKEETENAYNLSLSTSLLRLNRTKEALNYLDKIKTDNQNLLKIVEEQSKVIKRKSSKRR